MRKQNFKSRSGGGVQYFLNDVNNAWVCPN